MGGGKELANVAVRFAASNLSKTAGQRNNLYGFTGTMMCAYGVLGYITYGFDVSGCSAVG